MMHVEKLVRDGMISSKAKANTLMMLSLLNISEKRESCKEPFKSTRIRKARQSLVPRG